MRGRIGKTIAQHMAEGYRRGYTRGGRKITREDFIVEAGVPERPKGLSRLARREWQQIVPLLLERGTLSALDGKALAAYCESYAQAEAASKLIDKHGLMTVTFEKDGRIKNMRRNPAVSLWLDAAKVMLVYLDMFGLSPRSRLKLGVAAQKPKRSLAELMDDVPVVGFSN